LRYRPFGRFGQVSALTLGGGGLGQIWGETTREECVATARDAVGLGITCLDMAPSYGNGEAESVIGEAFEGKLPDGVVVTTKCRLNDTPAEQVETVLRESLQESLARMRLERVDLFFIHNYIAEDEIAEQFEERFRPTSLSVFQETVRPTLEAMVSDGLIRGWGLTGIGIPDTLIRVYSETPAPAATQCIANLLDSAGGLQRFDGPLKPRDVIAAAGANGVPVMGIRAVQAGALTDAIDRPLPEDHPEIADYRRAEPFRQLAREIGEPAASLAHRYSLSMPGIATVVLGVKNRQELRECVAAEEKGPLSPSELSRIDNLYREGSAASQAS
jgi:aryl-alcohol dehydrogenase-like predicted oxidoreductase